MQRETKILCLLLNYLDVATARAEPGSSLEPRASPRSSTLVQKQALGPSFAAFIGRLSGSWTGSSAVRAQSPHGMPELQAKA